MLLGDRLSELRKNKKETQEQTAKNLGLTRSAYSQYELNTRSPDQETLKKMADYFNQSIDYLLGRDTKESENTLPEEVILDVIRKAEIEYGVSLRDDPVVESAVRDLIHNLAKMKQSVNKKNQ
ncbi:helix-turn-helix transcriptional regulator [Paenibacillus sp. FSL R10-2796]|uniref:helix-turn-helix domain-containing protein n=1 Tax=Paenibacillus sp. FSL R10-2796 TaxID=2954663 RepID=UPI0030DB816B